MRHKILYLSLNIKSWYLGNSVTINIPFILWINGLDFTTKLTFYSKIYFQYFFLCNTTFTKARTTYKGLRIYKLKTDLINTFLYYNIYNIYKHVDINNTILLLLSWKWFFFRDIKALRRWRRARNWVIRS